MPDTGNGASAQDVNAAPWDLDFLRGMHGAPEWAADEIERLRARIAELERERDEARRWSAEGFIHKPTRDGIVSENERLRRALGRAIQHLEFNRWENDSGSDRRYEALQEVRALGTTTSTEPTPEAIGRERG